MASVHAPKAKEPAVYWYTIHLQKTTKQTSVVPKIVVLLERENIFNTLIHLKSSYSTKIGNTLNQRIEILKNGPLSGDLMKWMKTFLKTTTFSITSHKYECPCFYWTNNLSDEEGVSQKQETIDTIRKVNPPIPQLLDKSLITEGKENDAIYFTKEAKAYFSDHHVDLSKMDGLFLHEKKDETAFYTIGFNSAEEKRSVY